MTASAHPLQWPVGRKRTESWRRERAKFDVTFARARDNIVQEIGRLAGKYPDPQIVISTNIALRRDGLPLANQRQPDDPGVAVYFLYRKRAMSFSCDRWDRIEHNMQAIARTIEALRGIARWGTGDMLEAAFTGFAALPPPDAARAWWEVLGVARDATRGQITAAFRRLASAAHPDKGGTAEQMAQINRARDEGLAAWGIELVLAASAVPEVVPAGETPLPPIPANAGHVTRRIRACESEAPAQLVLEHAMRAYARAALSQRGGAA